MFIINLLFNNVALIQLIITLLIFFKIIIEITQLFFIISVLICKNFINIIIYNVIIITSYKNGLMTFFLI